MGEDQVKELKSKGYDLIARIENIESLKQTLIKDLQAINAEIQKLVQKPAEAPIPLKPELAST